MAGTILNIITVLVGSLLGLLIGNRLPRKMQESVVTGLGLVTLFVGIQSASHTGNVIIPLLAILVGVIIGELLDLDGLLNRFGGWLQQRFGRSGGEAESEAAGARERFITGYVTASLVFCVGPLTILGSIQDGMGLPAGFQQLAIKSTLDGFAALAFAASFGLGVLFSIVTILLVQGGLALAGSLAGNFMTLPMIDEMTAVGGIVLMGLALVLLDVKKPRVANFLPALLIAPLMVAAAELLGIPIYPF